MSDLGPALVGLLGVGIGGALTQVSEALRWRRERNERTRERRRETLMVGIRAGTDIVGHAGTITDAVGRMRRPPSPGSMNISDLDRAVMELSKSIDDLRLLGPPNVAQAMLGVFDAGVEIRQHVANLGSAEKLRELSLKLYEAKVRCLAEASRASLADAPGPNLSALPSGGGLAGDSPSAGNPEISN